MAVVDLGRPSALGATRRVESWTTVFSSAGAQVEVVRLLDECAAAPHHVLPAAVRACLLPGRVPESAMWRPSRLRDRLAALDPQVVVVTTARSFAPGTVPASARLVLDYVDLLSANYDRRARLASDPARAAAFRVLARRMARFERWPSGAARRVAAGAADAAALGAEWVPNVVTAGARPSGPPAHDVLFVGTLDYSPNVAAVRRLAGLWPRLQEVRPGTSLLVAGSRPTPEVRRLVDEHGWTMWPDFASLDEVYGAARLAVAPLTEGTGIQNKVLEAAVRGLPQVVSPEVLAGVGSDFPAVVARTDEDIVAEVVTLLDDPVRRCELADRGRRAIDDRFSVQRWAAWAAEVLEEARTPGTSGAGATHGRIPRLIP
ncbi:glycosyl transferase family 1 [Kineococcus xinjiangensis]|uniref:Glycosyl transferase family 1 n=1 Tax=Kineococcus xinjiangensis TaxID=512762 RepID=A0A2S6II48_9ACTN|nr:glycosyl transferase family 1 [Kineococcus xinjiangensis]